MLIARMLMLIARGLMLMLIAWGGSDQEEKKLGGAKMLLY